MPSRVVLIGAGSAVFGYNSVLDSVNLPPLRGINLMLHDLDSERLKAMASLAAKMNIETKAGLLLEATVDRQEALRDADFVVLSIAKDRMRRWRLDFEIPYRMGIKQVIGENGGPGGLFHTMRMVPPVLEICRDMEELCPDATLFNYTNPVSRLCMAIDKYTKIKTVGLCHEVEHQLERLAPLIGVTTQLIDATSTGLNHFSWFKSLHLKDGSDAYPMLKRGLETVKSGFQPLCRAMYRKFGLYPSTDDNHLGEYLAYAWDLCPPQDRGLNWIERMEANGKKNWEMINQLIDENKPQRIKGKLSGEGAMRIIAGIISDSKHTELQVNLPNNGQVSNLLRGAVVETPVVVDKNGVHPVRVGDIPDGLAALCNIQILVQRLVIEAAVTGDRSKALQAMLVDPVVSDEVAAEKAFDELLKVHRDMLPQFKEDM